MTGDHDPAAESKVWQLASSDEFIGMSPRDPKDQRSLTHGPDPALARHGLAALESGVFVHVVLCHTTAMRVAVQRTRHVTRRPVGRPGSGSHARFAHCRLATMVEP